MFLFVDNYDSFTFNVVEAFKLHHLDVVVKKRHEIPWRFFIPQGYRGVIIGPGPGHPRDMPEMNAWLASYFTKIPLFGLCLGHQCLAYALGGDVVCARYPYHGKSSLIEHDGSLLFTDLPTSFEVIRYHSLVVDPLSLPQYCRATSWSQDTREIMSLDFSPYKVVSVQFHPESIGSSYGRELIGNVVTYFFTM